MRKNLALLLAAVLAVPGAAAAQSAATAQKFKLKPGAVGQACLECHATFQDVLKKPFVHTPVKSKDCAGCHNPHAAQHGKLLDASPSQTCLACHADVVPKNARSTHRPVEEKGCAGCHDPHASAPSSTCSSPATSSAAAATSPSSSRRPSRSSSTSRWSRTAAPATTRTARPRPTTCSSRTCPASA